MSQFVPVCLCTEAQGWNHGWGSLLCAGLAGRKAGRLTVWVGGGEGRSVISVMIFMDVSQNKALAELEADQSPIHPQRFSGHVAPWDVCLLQILSNYKKSPCTLIFSPPAKFNKVLEDKHNKNFLPCYGRGVKVVVVTGLQIQVTLPLV